MDFSTLIHEPVFWYSVAFILFFVLLGRRLFKPLVAMLDNRAIQIRQDLDEAARLKREAEQMLAEAKREREAAMIEVRDMLDRSRQEALRIAEAAKHEAELNAQRRERMAQDRIHASERAAVAEVRARAAEIASEAAHAVVSAMLTPATDAALIDRAIAGLPGAFATRTAA